MPLPAYQPMLAQLGSLPTAAEEAGVAVEMKWDGIRCLGYVEGRGLRLASRTGKDITLAYPELYPLAGAVGGHDVVLDGEIIAFNDEGVPSFGALQGRMQQNAARAGQLARTVPVTYMVFDILHVDASTTIHLPYRERREVLKSIVTPGFRWQVPVEFLGHAQEALDASSRLGLEGVVVKRLTSPYRPGRRSAEWTKVKNWAGMDVVIGGWTQGTGRRQTTIGSLLLGAYDADRRLQYVGNVGTGFTQAMLADLLGRLTRLERSHSPFASPVPAPHARTARWAEPVLVGEVRYAELTGDRRLRHPSWRGLRPDIPAERVTTDQIRPTPGHGHGTGTAAAG
ncbi:non-homologous end-joining DNA ligase [Nonomuraea sp. NPDC050328]|uniref:non-homologous end-joining DNA ligase n=1 Tax=Nonomuraea sp. NPDC050328 TaxID=3364361 RepID=UPI0037A019B6